MSRTASPETRLSATVRLTQPACVAGRASNPHAALFLTDLSDQLAGSWIPTQGDRRAHGIGH